MTAVVLQLEIVENRLLQRHVILLEYQSVAILCMHLGNSRLPRRYTIDYFQLRFCHHKK